MATKKLKEKNSFMMYHTWINQFNMLSPEEFVNMVNNLYRSDKGEEPVLNTTMEKVIWEGIGFVVEANKVKWEERAAASRANGALGGAPPKITQQQSQMLNNIGTQNNPVGSPNNLNNPVGFSNNLNNLINVKGEMPNVIGELVSDNGKLEDVNSEMLNVSGKKINEKGELVSDRGMMLNNKGEGRTFDEVFADMLHKQPAT
jgi:hypothetical protein